MVISPGGARAPLATGPTTIVEHGRYVEWRCDARQRCTIIAHIAGRSFTVTDPTLPEPLAFRFEPDGTHLAIVRGGSLSIVDTATGVRFDRVVDDLAINYYSRNQPDTSLAMSVAFLPGSTGLVAATTRGLAFIDLEGVVRGLASHDSGNVPTVWSPLLGVGLGWPSGT
jgi:hypothetical protein